MQGHVEPTTFSIKPTLRVAFCPLPSSRPAAAPGKSVCNRSFQRPPSLAFATARTNRHLPPTSPTSDDPDRQTSFLGVIYGRPNPQRRPNFRTSHMQPASSDRQTRTHRFQRFWNPLLCKNTSAIASLRNYMTFCASRADTAGPGQSTLHVDLLSIFLSALG